MPQPVFYQHHHGQGIEFAVLQEGLDNSGPLCPPSGIEAKRSFQRPGINPEILDQSLTHCLQHDTLSVANQVCFERITHLMKRLKTAEIQKSAKYRIRRILKSSLVIIEEIGYTPIEKREANDFFNLISELYEKASIIVTSNKRFDSWAEMMGDQVMTTVLLDRLLHHARMADILSPERSTGTPGIITFPAGTIPPDPRHQYPTFMHDDSTVRT